MATLPRVKRISIHQPNAQSHKENFHRISHMLDRGRHLENPSLKSMYYLPQTDKVSKNGEAVRSERIWALHDISLCMHTNLQSIRFKSTAWPLTILALLGGQENV